MKYANSLSGECHDKIRVKSDLRRTSKRELVVELVVLYVSARPHARMPN